MHAAGAAQYRTVKVLLAEYQRRGPSHVLAALTHQNHNGERAICYASSIEGRSKADRMALVKLFLSFGHKLSLSSATHGGMLA